MNRIRLLPEHVANQIAAGEVVERPASVVKELVENALDAQSTRITVEIQAGGRSLIRVIDDGVGMSRDDALLCLERHATSKIERAEDLHRVATMGFRGEALPSIASVSRFTLITRERDAANPEGTHVVINGGKIIEVKAAGCPTGTAVEARSLFFNLPARRKFLRAEETESAHIQHYVTLAALAHPQVAFTFVKDGRVVWQLPAVKIEGKRRIAALQDRMRQMEGTLPSLIPVEATAPLREQFLSESENPEADAGGMISMWGLMGAPGVSRATREDQHLFVNRRPVESRALNYALLEGYHTALMKGRYPFCCLFIEIDPAAVDVNIHPSKREVKFRDERAVRRFVTETVRDALLDFHRPGTTQATEEPRIASPAKISTPARASVTSAPPTNSSRPTVAPFSLSSPPLATPSRAPEAAPLPLGFSKPAPERVASPAPGGTADDAPAPASQSAAPDSASPLLAVPLTLVGVIGRLYVVLESDRGLVLLDQHAAHERILYEQMLARIESGQVAVQRLLLPETVEISARDAVFLKENLPMLGRLGVGLSEFGERTFLLDALPPFVRTLRPREFVLGLIDELKAAGEGVNSMRLGEYVVARTVCRHAVKANDPLAGPELEKLLEDLRHCAMPYTCPHGRPTLIEMSYAELEKKFGRQQ